MGAQPLGPDHPRWNDILWAVKLREDGISQHGIANQVGTHRSTVQNWLKQYDALQSVDPAIQESMQAVGTGLVPKVVWAKQGPDGKMSYSALLKPPELPDDTLDRIRAAFEGMKPARPVNPPRSVNSRLLTLYPIFDAHIGMLAWGKETRAEDYNLSIASEQMRAALEKVTSLTPDSEEALLLVGGDFFHVDDTRNETPANRHRLDADGRFPKIINVGIEIIGRTIERLLHKHKKLHIRVIRGNHDEHSHLILAFSIANRYRNEERVFVETEAETDMLMRQWGRTAIFAHHGDRRFKPEQAALYISDVCQFWSETRHRYMFTGHVHHAQAKDTGPVKWESLRAFCPPDAYAAQMGYASRRELQAITFDNEDGLVLRAHDPVS